MSNRIEEDALQSVRAHLDRMMMAVCWLLWLLGGLFAPLQGEWLAWSAVGSPLALWPRPVRSCCIGQVIQTNSANLKQIDRPGQSLKNMSQHLIESVSAFRTQSVPPHLPSPLSL